MRARLTQKFIENVKPTGQLQRIFDDAGNGFHLIVKPDGQKYFAQRIRIDGKQVNFGLGPVRRVSLADARAKARKIERMVRDEGADAETIRREVLHRRPKTERQMTFRDAGNAYLKAKLQELSNPKHQAQWRSTLEAYVFPHIGDKPVADVTVGDVVSLLTHDDFWKTKTETASRVRGRVEKVFDWAITHGHRTAPNPAIWRGGLETVLPKPTKIRRDVRHHPAVAVGEIGRLWRRLEEIQGMGSLALRFLILTAARSGEVRGAKWSEINLENRTWTIPASRMKARKEHIVPLSDEAISLLKKIPKLNKVDYIFPGTTRGTVISDMTIAKAMKSAHAADERAGENGFHDGKSGLLAVPHGIRSTFRDWAEENGVNRDLAEMCLAHTVGSAVERAYRRTDLIEKRREIMQNWSNFVVSWLDRTN